MADSTLDPQRVKPVTDIRRTEDLVELDSTDVESTAGEVSPHYGGRAQPGDILGIETGGETTGIGDSSEDENKRRHAAEKAAAKVRQEEAEEIAKGKRP